MTGTIKQSQLKRGNKSAVPSETPFCKLSVTMAATANEVRKDKIICAEYIFGIFGFDSAISFSCSSLESLSKPRYCMCTLPIGVLGEYQSVPKREANAVPTKATNSIVTIFFYYLI